MPRISQKFIDRKIRRPDNGQVIYRDDELIGFGLRVTRGSMSYIVECRVNGVNKRITIGPHGRFDPDTAREEAKKLLATMTRGRDPRVEEAKEKLSQITLGEVLEDYLSSRTLRPNSIRTFRSVPRRCLGDWLPLPIVNITKEMVETRHRELTRPTRMGTSGKAQANIAMECLCTLINFAMNKYEIDGKPIIQKNPVDRLSQIRAWHVIPRRQTVIPDHKLPSWYQEVISVRDKKVRDYLLFLLFTGLRRTEAATLKWEDVDLEGKVLTIRSEIAKNHHEHRLPLTDFLHALLTQRKTKTKDSEFVFPGRGFRMHMVDSDLVYSRIGERCGCKFTLHDLRRYSRNRRLCRARHNRRTFLALAERLSLSYVVLKKLANHSGKNDTTFGYVVVDVERLREPMQMITNEFIRLFNQRKEDQ